jgi:alpha-L-fucosidase
MKRGVFILSLLMCLTNTWGQIREDVLFFKDRIQAVEASNIYDTEDYYNWGPSIIKGKEGTYHMFYSRWKKEYEFTGWLTHSEIAHASSDSPTGPWRFVRTVMKGRGNPFWDAVNAHNPKIKYFEGKYYLYYISTNLSGRDFTEKELAEIARVGYSHPDWKVLRPNQRTGVAVAESLEGPWRRMDQPLIEPSGPITTLTVNPGIDQGKDGKYYLVVKGDKPNESDFVRNQALAVSDSPGGPFVMQEQPVISDLDTEDMSIWYDQKRDYYYGVFHAHDFIGMVSSPDGITWNKATEYILTDKQVQMKDGTTLIPDRMERPFVLVEDDEPKVLAYSVKKGDHSFIITSEVKQFDIPVPNKRQQAWQEAEMGAVFHYDLHVFDGEKYGQSDNRISPIRDYQIFNPTDLDTDQWIKAAKDAGFTFAILTASHETGFALFQSEVNPYSMRALNYKDGKGDLVRDFVESCRKYGVKPGIYIGIRWNAFYGVRDFKVNGEGTFREKRQAYYNEMVEGMVKEICTNYGELFEIWFDGGADSPHRGAPDVLPIVQKYQPNCLFYHNKQLAEARWGGSESGTVSYPSWATFPYHSTGAGESAAKAIAVNNFELLKTGDPEGAYWVPPMSDAPLRGYNGRHEWFWEPGDEAHIFPLENLMEMYYKSVGRNSTLIMGLTPDDRGLLPDEDVARLVEWGAEIKRRFNDPLAAASGKGSELVINFDEKQVINHVILREDIALGERVRVFRIEGMQDGQWNLLYTGSNIGNKHIARFDDSLVSSVRLTIEAFRKEPLIKSFQVFNVED